MFYVTATTNKCFRQHQYFDPVLRWMVFLLVPVPHLLWLFLIPFLIATAGTLYYIGPSTRTIFEHEYAKAWCYGRKTITFDPDSHIGYYLTSCQKYMDSDYDAEQGIYVLKAICSLIPGILLGALPCIPFTFAILAITIHRLPINLYRSMKVALFTVTLKWDFKILFLFLLPFAHTMFPLMAFGTAFVGSFLYFISITTASIIEGDNPFDNWGQFNTVIREYCQAHQDFAGAGCLGQYDHPTGIPLGWGGQIYGLPIQMILQWLWDWLWDFVVCLALLLVALPFCFFGSVLIFAVKLVPGTLSWWRKLCKDMSGGSIAECLGCWPCYLAGIILAPFAAVSTSFLAVCSGTSMAFRTCDIYLQYGYLAGCYEILCVLHDMDNFFDIFPLNGFVVFVCLPGDNSYQTEDNRLYRQHRRSYQGCNFKGSHESRMFSSTYWDRFADQCVQSRYGLLDKRWITLEQLARMDSSILQIIPAVAVLNILVDSLHDPEAEKPEDIAWKLDGTLCKQTNIRSLDNVGAILWPKVMEIKNLLKKQDITDDRNIQDIMAMICSNNDEPTEELEAYITARKTETKKKWKNQSSKTRVQSKLIELALMILQVKPFRNRLTAVFGYTCARRDDEEGGVAGREQRQATRDARQTSRGARASRASEETVVGGLGAN